MSTALVLVGAVIHLDSGAIDGPDRFSNASLTWAFNQELNTGAFDGSCNHLSAGRTDGSPDQYLGTDGDVTVEKLDAVGTFRTITDWTSRCRDASGAAVTAGGNRRLGLRIRMTGGDGTRDSATGTTVVQWSGTFAANVYDELVPLWFSDLRLVLSPTGDATLTATIAGFASSLENPEVRSELAAQPDVVIARSTGVHPDGFGAFTITPHYLGVTYDSAETPQSRTSPNWGAWPSELVRSMERSGTAAYWFSTGGASDARKVPTPIDVDLGTSPTTTAPPTTVSPTTTAPPTTVSPTTVSPTTVSPTTRPATPTATVPSAPAGGLSPAAPFVPAAVDHVGAAAPAARPTTAAGPTSADTAATPEPSGERTSRRLTASLRYHSMHSVFEPSWNPGAPGRMRVTYTVVNTGEVTVAARGRTEVATSVGPDPDAQGNTDVPPLAPGRTRTVVEVVDDVWPGFGTRTSIELQPFVPSEPSIDLADATITARTSTTVWPWRPLAALLTIASAAALATVLVSNRQTPHAG